MWLRFRHLVLLALLPLFAACAGVTPDTYKAEKPVLELDRYFNGTLDAWGMFTDRSGRVVKRFTVVMVCTWNGDTGTLDEDFTYSDGSREKRVWTIRKLGGGRYLGTAADVVGEALGTAAGNALNWRYVLDLKAGEQRYHVDFDDWMVLMDDEVMLNRAVMSKFGITLGEVTLSFRKRK
jgi:Protein of unknown function (DUF3833)